MKKKDIICVKFNKEDITIEEADEFFKDIYNYLKENYYVIGVLENLVNIEAVSGDTKILYINGKQVFGRRAFKYF